MKMPFPSSQARTWLTTHGSFNYRWTIAIIAQLLLMSSLILPGLAQQAANNTSKTAPRREPPQLSAQRQLQSPPSDFPFPFPSGSKFIMGYEAQYQHSSRPTLFMRLESQSNIPQLTAWYKQTIQGMGWQLNVREPSTAHKYASIFASKGGATCSINLRTVRSGSRDTAISITYNHN